MCKIKNFLNKHPIRSVVLGGSVIGLLLRFIIGFIGSIAWHDVLENTIKSFDLATSLFFVILAISICFVLLILYCQVGTIELLKCCRLYQEELCYPSEYIEQYLNPDINNPLCDEEIKKEIRRLEEEYWTRTRTVNSVKDNFKGLKTNYKTLAEKLESTNMDRGSLVDRLKIHLSYLRNCKETGITDVATLIAIPSIILAVSDISESLIISLAIVFVFLCLLLLQMKLNKLYSNAIARFEILLQVLEEETTPDSAYQVTVKKLKK